MMRALERAISCLRNAMNPNRLSHLVQPEPLTLPAGQPASVLPAGFAVCPFGLVPASWQQLYAAAYERARATLEPQWSGRLNLECWN
jgi:hypothetical protein